MSLPLLTSAFLSLLVLAIFAGSLWRGQRWLWAHKHAQALPARMGEGMPVDHARQIVAFLVTTVGMLVIGGCGLLVAHLAQVSSVGVELPSGAMMLLLIGSALSLVVLAALARWHTPKAWLTFSGLLQAVGVGLVWGLAGFGAMGWGLTFSHGPSMAPSLPDELSLGVVDLNAYKRNPPLVGDIVTFRGVEGWASGAYNKRVVGVSGDAFQYAFDQVWKNGHPLVNCSARGCFARPSSGVVYEVTGNAWKLPDGWGLKKANVVAEDHFFVLGDNLAISGDSRFFGAIPRHALEGKIVAVLGRHGYQRVDGT